MMVITTMIWFITLPYCVDHGMSTARYFEPSGLLEAIQDAELLEVFPPCGYSSFYCTIDHYIWHIDHYSMFIYFV